MGFMYPKRCICFSEGLHLRLAIERKIYLFYLFSNVFIHISKYCFQKIIICVLSNTLTWRYKNGVYFIKLEKSKGSVDLLFYFSLFATRNFRVTWLSVQMLKGYMIRERLRTSVFVDPNPLHFLTYVFEQILYPKYRQLSG